MNSELPIFILIAPILTIMFVVVGAILGISIGAIIGIFAIIFTSDLTAVLDMVLTITRIFAGGGLITSLVLNTVIYLTLL